jgi:HD-GYP domain-containing protein (c-di-GMP phosphodiesterase class II)
MGLTVASATADHHAVALAREHLAALAALQAAAACDRADRELPRLALAALARLVPADGQIVWLRAAHDQDSVRTLSRDATGEHASEGLVAGDPLLTAILLDGARSFAPGARELRGSRLVKPGASVAATPIELGGARLGALAAVHADGTLFAQPEVDLLALGASTLALTLVAMAGREDRERSIERETMLVSTLASTAMAPTVQLALEQVTDGARRIASAPLAAILLAEPGGTRLAAISGDAAPVLLDIDAMPLAPLLDAFEPGPLSRGEPFLHLSLPGLLADLAPRRAGLRARVRAGGLGAALVCPLVVPDGVVGVLLIALPDAPLDPPSIPPLAALAAHVGGLLARSEDGTRHGPRREAGLALAAALAERDPRAGVDARVVSGFARTLARKLGLDDELCEEAELAGLLHDIGKLALPDRILDKPAVLEPGERAVIQEHPAIGERILRAVPGLATIADAVRSSHERFDGTGYPDGLAGEAIPRIARIVAVCDSWHALTSDRPQRARLESPEALGLLHSLAGTALDPEIVGALCEVLGTHADRALRHAS